jgi:hypothetical protein
MKPMGFNRAAVAGRWLCAVAVLLVAGTVAADDGETAGDGNSISPRLLRTLRDAGIEPTAEGIRAWLEHLRPSSDHRKLARRYVAELASKDWRKRESATRSLLSLPTIPGGLLDKAARSDDPEVAARAKEILARRGEGISPVLRAAFCVIEKRRYRSCLEATLESLPLCRRPYVRQTAADALVAIVRPGDLETVQKAFEAADTRTRMVLMAPLAAALGQERSDRLARWMRRGDPQVRLRAAVAMLNLKNRHGLDGLVDLLDANDPQIRTFAAATLRSVTGTCLDYKPTGPAEARRKGMEKWTQWVQEEGQKVKLRLPARVGWGCRGDLGGNYLVAYGYKHKVEEVAPDGSVVWSHEAKGAWSAEKLPDGNVLIAAYSENKVVLVNPEGKRIWEYGTNCLNAELLPNGNFLVADYSGNRVIEINRDKEVVWTYKTGGSCADAERLPNGNTLVACGSDVREVTPGGQIVWEHNVGTQVYSVQHLPTGNLLVSLLSRSRVEEITRKGKTVWTQNINSPSDAFRLPNGNTLVTGSGTAFEVTPEGKKIWSRDGLSYGTLRK